MSDPIPNLFPALDTATEAALRESIKRFGVLVPVVRDQHGRTLDGHHRSRIAGELGVKHRVDIVTVADDEEARAIAASLNTDRRQLDPEQRREIVVALREQGHSTTAIAGAIGVNQSTVVRDIQAMQPHNVPSEVTGQDGKRYPAKRPTVVTARDVDEADRAQDALALAPATGRVVDAVKIQRQANRERTVQERPAPAPAVGTYSVLYVDPPWRYEHVPVSESRAIENHYPTMSLDELKALDVPAADDAVLFMWATSPKLAEAIELVAAWGFSYRTSAVWVKDRIGMGYYVRAQHELLLIAKRGDIHAPAESARVSSVINAPRGRHSAKPELVYGLIETMYPNAPRIEMFARDERDGWASWGNEVAA